MCGFAAFFQKDRRFPQELADRVNEDLYHRGPDSAGFYCAPGCSIIFRRLAILDPSDTANQPMISADGRYVLVFNGEIYNYPELRRDLEQKGVRFNTSSDTEALLLGFLHWGEAVVYKLEGMYAFVIWDKKEKTAYAARDPLGIKPLYMARKGALVAFASETRPLRRVVGTEVDPSALAEALVMRFATGRRGSYLKNIEMIPGGTIIRYKVQQNDINEYVFEDVLNTFREELSMSYTEALDIAEAAVVESVKRHLRSDVGYSVQLSGGIDSSLITAIAAENSRKNLCTYGIRLEDPKHDEGAYRQSIVERYHTDHHEIMLTGKDFAAGLIETCRSLEGPTAHMGCVFLKYLSQEIGRKHKVTLVGEGADEFFGGYDRYSKISNINKNIWASRVLPSAVLKSVPRLHNVLRYKTLDAALVAQTLHDHNSMMDLFPELTYGVAIESRIRRFKDLRIRIAAADQLSYLGSMLLRQDKISMAHSVEVRTPFAHMPLAIAINKIPSRFRFPGNMTKPLLKKIAEKWLPTDLIYRRKNGLTLPVFEWMADDNILKPMVMDLTRTDCALAEYADPKELKSLVENYFLGRLTKPTHVKIVPILMITNLWLEELRSEGIKTFL